MIHNVRNAIILILILVASFLGYMLYETGRALIAADTSLTSFPSDFRSKPNKPPVYLVSYADGHEVFYRNQRTLAHSALGRGVDFILNYNRSHIDPAFIKKNQAIFDQKSGAGYWLWKPWIIQHALKHAPENAIVIYADTGFVVHDSLTPILRELEKSDIILCEYEKVEVHGLLKHATTRTIFKKLNADNSNVWNQKRIIGGFIALRNTTKARDFIDEWLKHCQDPVMLTGQGDTNEQLPEFRNHYHDQSILSVMAAKRKDIHRLKYQAELITHFMVWHHRRPGAKSKDPAFVWSTLSHFYTYRLNKRVRQFYDWIAYRLYGQE